MFTPSNDPLGTASFGVSWDAGSEGSQVHPARLLPHPQRLSLPFLLSVILSFSKEACESASDKELYSGTK